MKLRPRFCVYCSKEAIPGFSLCEVCLLGLATYPDQNEVIFRAYFDFGHAEIAATLKDHAAFQCWLTEHHLT